MVEAVGVVEAVLGVIAVLRYKCFVFCVLCFCFVFYVFAYINLFILLLL